MKRNRYAPWFLSMAGLVILILDGRTALHGALDGIELCLKTVIPALFPFFVLSAVLIRCRMPSFFFEKAAARLLRLPQGAQSLLIPCILGGYPVGAKCVHQMYVEGSLDKRSAERLLAFCSNAGPAFLFGMIGQVLSRPWMPWALWGIHLLGALAAAYRVPAPDTVVNCKALPQNGGTDLMAGAVSSMGIVCGWIVIFRVMIAFLNRWFLWLLPQTARVAVIGLLELSNGCCELTQIPDMAARFVLCSGLLAAGGLCVTAQTISVTHGLSLRYYCFGKLIQTVVSLLLSFSIVYQTPMPLLGLLPLLLRRPAEKRSGKQAPNVV